MFQLVFFSSGVAVTLCAMEEQCVCVRQQAVISLAGHFEAQQSDDTALTRRADSLCLTAELFTGSPPGGFYRSILARICIATLRYLKGYYSSLATIKGG